MRIIEVNTKKEFKDFLRVPSVVHADDPNFIAPLRADVKATLDFKKNPYWQTSKHKLFVAYQGDKPVGRIGAFYNLTHQHLYRDDCGYFGYLECIRDPKLFAALTVKAEIFLRTQGAKKMIGPINPSINYELGVLTKGFEEKPYFMMNYNPEWYPELYKNHSFTQEMGFKAYSITPELQKTKIERISEKIMERYEVEIEEVDFKNFKPQANQLMEIYNDAFSGHWGFVPFSEGEFQYMAKDMSLVLNKKLIFKIKVKGELAGFILAFPNLNSAIAKLKDGRLGPIGLLKFMYHKRRINAIKVTVAAIKKKFQHMGLGSVLYGEIAKRGIAEGYTLGELSWVADDNPQMHKVIQSMGAEVTKEYAVYAKEIST